MDEIRLERGSHKTRSDGMCFMEAVAFHAGEWHSSNPSCVCPVIRSFMIIWNDGIKTNRERTLLLSQLIPVVSGTATKSHDVMNARSFMILDWVIRSVLPDLLDLRHETKEDAEALRALTEIKKDSDAESEIEELEKKVGKVDPTHLEFDPKVFACFEFILPTGCGCNSINPHSVLSLKVRRILISQITDVLAEGNQIAEGLNEIYVLKQKTQLSAVGLVRRLASVKNGQ